MLNYPILQSISIMILFFSDTFLQFFLIELLIISFQWLWPVTYVRAVTFPGDPSSRKKDEENSYQGVSLDIIPASTFWNRGKIVENISQQQDSNMLAPQYLSEVRDYND